MEQLGLGWMGELGKQGFLGLIVVIEGVIIWWLDKRCQKCQEQGRADAERLAGILERCNAIMLDTAKSQPELIQTVKEFAAVLQAVIKQQDVSDDRARERAERIERSVEQVVRVLQTAAQGRIVGG